MLHKVPHTLWGAEMSSLIHPELCSAGRNNLLPCEYPAESWFYPQYGKSYIYKGSWNKGK